MMIDDNDDDDDDDDIHSSCYRTSTPYGTRTHAHTTYVYIAEDSATVTHPSTVRDLVGWVTVAESSAIYTYAHGMMEIEITMMIMMITIMAVNTIFTFIDHTHYYIFIIITNYYNYFHYFYNYYYFYYFNYYYYSYFY